MRLPFGISSASEEFQRRLHEALHDIPGIEIIVDDIIVFGQGDNPQEYMDDHDGNLKNLVQKAREVNLKLMIRNYNYRYQKFHLWESY